MARLNITAPGGTVTLMGGFPVGVSRKLPRKAADPFA
jgi:hypothetical protein